MSERHDLSRWNRAGLNKFRYVDGNAVNWLEALRSSLAGKFPEWKAVQTAHASGTESEMLASLLNQYQGERRDMLWEITRAFARSSHVLTETLDVYANEGYLSTVTQWDNLRRMVEMLDYYPTSPASAVVSLALIASQQGEVSSSLQIKYSPPDGEEPVVFETLEDIDIDPALNQLHPKDWNKSRSTLSGNGSWVSAKGEFVSELDISSGDLGILLCPDMNRAQTVSVSRVNADNSSLSFAYPGLAAASQWREYQSKLLLGSKDIRPFKLRGSGVVRLKGHDNKPHDLSVGDVIAWNKYAGWEFNEVVASDDKSVRLSNPGLVPARGSQVYRFACINKTDSSALPGGAIVFPLSSGDSREIVAGRWPDGAILRLAGSHYKVVGAPDFEKNTYREVTEENISEIYIKYPKDISVATVEDSEPLDFTVEGAAKGLKSGDWIIGEGGRNNRICCAMQIASIVEQENSFVLGFSAISDDSVIGIVSETLTIALRKIQVALDESVLCDKTLGYFIDGRAANLPVTAIQGVGSRYASRLGDVATLADLSAVDPDAVKDISLIRLMEFKTKADMVLDFKVREEDEQFASELVYDLLQLPLPSHASTLSDSEIRGIERFHGPFSYELFPQGYDRNLDRLKQGKEIRVEEIPPELAVGRKVLLVCQDKALTSEIAKIDTKQGVITLAHSIDNDHFVKADTSLFANVVRAGHGETQSERVLGSGDATQSNQSFVFKHTGVAFIPDATMSCGVRAAVDVKVDGRIWQQTSSLNDSGPTDMHYCVRMTEEGYVRICFGDGGHGRRLPSGTNNLRISWRKGSGLSGNLDAGSLVKTAKPHRLIDVIHQPQSSSGGAEMEALDAVRSNAPRSLRTLERAVSVSDFEHLAAGQSSIWQANAFSLTSGVSRQQKVEVVVVPSGGTVLGHESKLSLQTYLEQYALPGTLVKVSEYERLKLLVEVVIQVKTDAFDPETVKMNVKNALLQALTLEARQLEKPLYRADLYQIVESVQGVENSICTFLPDMKVTNSRGDILGEAEVIIHSNGDIRCVKASARQAVYLPADGSGLFLDHKVYSL